MERQGLHARAWRLQLVRVEAEVEAELELELGQVLGQVLEQEQVQVQEQMLSGLGASAGWPLLLLAQHQRCQLQLHLQHHLLLCLLLLLDCLAPLL